MTSRYAAPILRDGRNFFHALPRCAPSAAGRRSLAGHAAAYGSAYTKNRKD